ncbi:hypothetical protein Tco_1348778 [Tanacetum coccineum]
MKLRKKGDYGMMFDPEEVQHIMMRQILALFTGIRSSNTFYYPYSHDIPRPPVQSDLKNYLVSTKEEDGDDKDTFDMWDITIGDVERIRKFLTPNVPKVIEDVIQLLIPKTLHTIPPNEDYVAPATKSILTNFWKNLETRS